MLDIAHPVTIPTFCFSDKATVIKDLDIIENMRKPYFVLDDRDPEFHTSVTKLLNRQDGDM